MHKKASAHSSVMDWKHLEPGKILHLERRPGHDTVMLETMSTMVLVMPSGCSKARGARCRRGADAQEDVGGKQRAEQHDFRRQKSQMPTLALNKPVSWRGSTV